jgi:hypothetical protein
MAREKLEQEGEAGGRATGRGARKTSAGSSARSPRSTRSTASGSGTAPKARSSGGAGDLRSDLRDFASARPQGWGHDDWLNFLESLRNRGHDVRDHDAVGLALEKERLDLALSQIQGIGAQRRKTLVDRFGTLWSLRNADVDEVARLANIPRSLAERVKGALH